MAQEEKKILPKYLNLDTDISGLHPEETIFKKGLEITINANPELGNGTNNPSGEGQNSLVLTPSRSNIVFPNSIAPPGTNKNGGGGECVVTNEFYYFNINSNGNHGIYVLSGDTGAWSTIIIDPKLKFSSDPSAFISDHRVRLRVVYDENKNIIEKYLIWTDGQMWQGWINVIAAINTNGFDAGAFPYWSLQPPHFDREELFQYAFRPPMFNPLVTKVANVSSDAGKLNLLLDNAFEICYQFVYTDGRETTVSPFSAPCIIQATDFLSDPDVISKNLLITLYAGSPLVEYINIYYRQVVKGDKGEYNGDLVTWTDWFLYDTIYKYTDSDKNSDQAIGNNYWLRTNQWSLYNYDPIQNTIQYVFDNSKFGQIVDKSLFARVENSLPLLSVAMSDAGDSILLANNKYNYDNFNGDVLDKIGMSVEENKNSSCSPPLRNVRLYAMAARERGNFGSIRNSYARNIWISEVGYNNGKNDLQMRFGGIGFDDITHSLSINVDESKEFNLDFANQDSFTVYIKGTQYSAVGEWHVVNNVKDINGNWTLTKIDHLLDVTNTSDQNFINAVLKGGGMFICVFNLVIPAGKYIATLGRHNVASTENFRAQSTYIMGIANSKLATNYPTNYIPTLKVITPNDIVDTSKEMEIDCTNGDSDVWGNGHDLFYVCTPFNGSAQGENNWSFVEGYLLESATSDIPVEKFPYALNIKIVEYNGGFTDKNGFFWGYSWGGFEVPGFITSNNVNVVFTTKIDCQNTVFTVLNNVQGQSTWKPNNLAYLVDYNTTEPGKVGFGSYVVLKGRITDLTSTFGYSNIAVSIKDGATAYTRNDGTFELIIHNGFSVPRQSNVYINAGGNFNIYISDCGYIPIFQYDENNVPCQIRTERVASPISLSVNAQGSTLESLKSNASYVTCVIGADKAGRVTSANVINTITVPSFLSRGLLGDTKSTYFKWLLSGALGLDKNSSTKDIAYIGFATSKPTNYEKYVQWVGDEIVFYDQNNNVTLNPDEAVFVGIVIQSLLETNIQNNLSYLASYQFNKNDRVRIYDNGDGVLLNTGIYGEMIDSEIQGSQYNQAAINANLIVPPVNTVLPSTQNPAATSVTLFVLYDSRFNALQNKTGFWIELFTPSKNNNKLPVFEIKWYPVIKGEIAMYVGGGVDEPEYDYLTTDNLDYWDTYLIKRNISIQNVGEKFIGHPFESPNITDTWGANASSGGRPNAIDPYALQMWYLDDAIRSNDFVSRGKINGLGTFLEENRKSFKGYQRGGIMAIICQYSTILFICEKDWFVTDFNYQYIYANAQGVQVANLDDNLSVPQQKIGSNFGCSYEDTGTIVSEGADIFWYDRNNTAYIKCNYSAAEDISDIRDSTGRMVGIKSYLIAKTKFITQWNKSSNIDSIFDVMCGIDRERNNVYITFRPRRKNTNDLNSYISTRRNTDIKYQETFMYSIDDGRWTSVCNFCPESFGKIRGDKTGIQLITFAAGIPYMHNSASTFLNYYGIQTEPCVIGVINEKPNDVKILEAISQDYRGQIMYVDLIYDSQQNSFSYIPLNKWTIKEKMAYASVLKDMTSYLAPDKTKLYRSTLQDGKRIFGPFFVVRFIGNYNTLGQYFEIVGINSLFSYSAPTNLAPKA